MPNGSRKNLDKKIKDCRQLVSSKKVISCLEALFLSINDGLVAYELGHEFEKIGKIQMLLNTMSGLRLYLSSQYIKIWHEQP